MSRTSEQRIAKVRSMVLGFEDHGILTATVDFDYGGAGQGIGARCFGSHDESRDPEGWRRGHEMGMDFVRRLLLACGVSEWDRLKGRTVMVTCTYSEILRIDPLPTEGGEPFDIEAWADSWKRDAVDA
jgi:hypothetical protein